MKLIFLYVQHRHGRYFAERVREEGYFCLIRRMVETGVVEEAVIVIESGPDQSGEVRYGPGLKAIITNDLPNLLAPGSRLLESSPSILFVRGGWRSWFAPLQALVSDHWLVFYAANTDRYKWLFWHVVLDDLSPSVIPAQAGIQATPFMDAASRLHLDFRKPINQEIFHHRTWNVDSRSSFDLCIGASRVHDRKGQWRVINAMIAHQVLYGAKLRAVLPGPWAHGTETSRIQDKLQTHDLDVHIPGELARPDLAELFHRSLLFVHLGSHGQGDRGVMEAMACGCPVIVGFPRYHAPSITAGHRVCGVTRDPDNPKEVARLIHARLGVRPTRECVAGYFKQHDDLDAHSLSCMRILTQHMKVIGKPDRQALAKEYGL